MKKHETQSWKARVACNQAERVAHTARWVLTIDGKGAVLSVVQNKPHQLDVMAVIGPAEAGGIRYEQTVLVEIGIRRGKPYSQGKPIDSLTGKRKRIFTRQKFATIDLPRLCRMWKRLESVMVEEASGMSRVGILFQRGKQELLDGIVFTISEKDPLMLAAILQSERRMRTNPLDEDMEKAAIFLRRTLEPHNDLSFAPKKDIVRAVGRKRSGLEKALWFLNHRCFLPHQRYLVEKLLWETPAWDIYARLMRDFLSDTHGTYTEPDPRVSVWGALLELRNVPTFNGVYVWTRKESFHRRQKRIRGNEGRRAYFFSDVLTLYFTPEEIVEEVRMERKGDLILPDGARRTIRRYQENKSDDIPF